MRWWSLIAPIVNLGVTHNRARSHDWSTAVAVVPLRVARKEHGFGWLKLVPKFLRGQQVVPAEGRIQRNAAIGGVANCSVIKRHNDYIDRLIAMVAKHARKHRESCLGVPVLPKIKLKPKCSTFPQRLVPSPVYDVPIGDDPKSTISCTCNDEPCSIDGARLAARKLIRRNNSYR